MGGAKNIPRSIPAPCALCYQWIWIGDTTDEQIVRIIDDAVQDDGETVKVRISNARLEKEDDDGDPTNDVVKELDITRAVATGTIHNEGSLQRAWLARFGRTVGTQVTDAMSERMRRGPERESHLTFGGQRLALGERTREPHLTMRGQHLALGEGRLAAEEADAHRLRLVVEGSRGYAWPTGRTLDPSLELGLRRDWGDAETGLGLELGARVGYADPAAGLSMQGVCRARRTRSAPRRASARSARPSL